MCTIYRQALLSKYEFDEAHMLKHFYVETLATSDVIYVLFNVEMRRKYFCPQANQGQNNNLERSDSITLVNCICLQSHTVSTSREAEGTEGAGN